MEGRTGGKTRKKISDGERRRRKSEGKERYWERERGVKEERNRRNVLRTVLLDTSKTHRPDSSGK